MNWYQRIKLALKRFWNRLRGRDKVAIIYQGHHVYFELINEFETEENDQSNSVVGA